MWKLVGVMIDRPMSPWMLETDVKNYERIVATFDTKRKAQDYEKKARLKQPHDGSIYKKKSLLRVFDEAYVEQIHGEETPPHNPKI